MKLKLGSTNTQTSIFTKNIILSIPLAHTNNLYSATTTWKYWYKKKSTLRRMIFHIFSIWEKDWLHTQFNTVIRSLDHRFTKKTKKNLNNHCFNWSSTPKQSSNKISIVKVLHCDTQNIASDIGTEIHGWMWRIMHKKYQLNAFYPDKIAAYGSLLQLLPGQGALIHL